MISFWDPKAIIFIWWYHPFEEYIHLLASNQVLCCLFHLYNRSQLTCASERGGRFENLLFMHSSNCMVMVYSY